MGYVCSVLRLVKMFYAILYIFKTQNYILFSSKSRLKLCVFPNESLIYWSTNNETNIKK